MYVVISREANVIVSVLSICELNNERCMEYAITKSSRRERK